MIVFITIFGVSLLATLAFIYVRVHNIRTGRIALDPEGSNKSRKVYTKVVETKEKTAWYGRNFFKIAILLILKLVVFVSFMVKESWNELQEALKERFTQKKNPKGQAPSAFIETVREYKSEISKFQKELGDKK